MCTEDVFWSFVAFRIVPLPVLGVSESYDSDDSGQVRGPTPMWSRPLAVDVYRVQEKCYTYF